MAFTPFVETDAPTMAAFNEKFAQAIAEAEGGALEKGTKIETGSYVGTGTYGESNPNTLTFDFEPVLFVLFPSQTLTMNQISLNNPLLLRWGHTTTFTTGTGTSNQNPVSYNGNTISWYSSGGNATQYNTSGTVYQYVAIG